MSVSIRYQPFLPEQVGPAGQNFAAVDNILVWKNIGPRIGASYDVSGKGKTVVKVELRQILADPPLTLPTTSTRTRDLAPDLHVARRQRQRPLGFRRHRARRLRSLAARRPPSTIPTSRTRSRIRRWSSSSTRPRRISASAPDLSGTDGVQLTGSTNINRPLSAYTVPVTIRDVGPDGRASTADDGAVDGVQPGAGVPDAAGGEPDVEPRLRGRSRTTTRGRSRRRGGRPRVGRCWRAFARTWNLEGAIAANATPNILINTQDGQNKFATWQAKINATLTLPHGLRVTPILRHQSGTAFARTFTTALNYSSAVVIKAELFGDERTPHLRTLFDPRTEKVFTISGRRLSGFFDVTNIFNSNEPQTVTITSGSAWRSRRRSHRRASRASASSWRGEDWVGT